MATAASVVVCALSLLGRSAETLPPITLVDVPPPEVSRRAEGFTEGRRIFLVTSSEAFRLATGTAGRTHARCGDRVAIAKVASVIVHEEWHVRHGTDEGRAYDEQIMTLLRLGFGPDTAVLAGVRASKRAVLRAQAAAAWRPDAVITISKE